MNRLRPLLLAIASFPAWAAWGTAHTVAAGQDASLPASAAEPVDFAREIWPLLQENCGECHGNERQKGGLRLNRRSTALAGGDSGPVILPGSSADSPLVRYVAGVEDGLQMPPEGPPLSAEQVGLLRRWIDDGATWPDALAGDDRPDPTAWWSLRPLARPPLPAADAQWPRWSEHPVDAFIAARFRPDGLNPSPPAARSVLIRRLTFDLHGLPPTPEEVEQFVADSGPLAYERLVDRLLASPRYGERQARHWMDVVHFAETHGHDQDRIREHAWPYRDYLIQAFNADTPYARFVQEQVAADALFPEQPGLAPALGFLSAGPWDESSLRDIRDDTLDRQIAHYLDRDDMLATVMSTFTSSTVHCARCHDHKFDPITQGDYYSLQACLAGVGRGNHSFDGDPTLAVRRRELTVRATAVAAHDPQLNPVLASGDFQARLSEWERRQEEDQIRWTILTPATYVSSAGATLTCETDLSIVASGPRPETDTYTITAQLPPGPLSAMRLELLDDDRLPQRGPGRQDNGNLHLSELRMEGLTTAAAGAATQVMPMPVRLALADFDQDGWTVAHAIDGDPATAWGIHPQVGKPHEAVFVLAEPLATPPSELRIVLEQQHGRSHLLGRFRLAVTSAPQPALAAHPPADVEAVLQVPVASRSAEQQATLAWHFLRLETEQDLATLPKPRQVYAAAHDFAPDGSHRPQATPRTVQILKRGEITRPGEVANPGALSCVPALVSRFELVTPADEASRRAALARWLAANENPLTWRSIANRVWHYHFGRGLVETPNDFGRMGTPPTHPELLDWLAVEFRDSGGSLKALHRLLVTSATYRQASADRPECRLHDADNRLLWRMPRTRLDAESYRDAVLQVAGRLDPRMGGPSVREFSAKPGLHVTPLVNYSEFNWNAAGSNRRAVYRFIFRTLPDPFLDNLDCPDASQLTAVRNVSVTPLAALSLMNNEFLLTHSEHLAARVADLADNLTGKVALACRLALGREPTATELGEWSTFAAAHGLPALARVLFNSNEFMFVD